MKFLLAFVTVACAIFGFTIGAQTSPQNNSAGQKNTTITERASGPFEVNITPQKADTKEAEAAGLSRMPGDKQYHGDLEATGHVEMLATSATAPHSGAYVALERVTGKLKGRSGSFTLCHTGIMNRGTPELTILVVPDSGTQELTGISGTMKINIAAGGKHSYEMEYTVAGKE
ncbi:MAG TPA: DUF3224 domain-containing protein [Terriglobales bacterium]|nr:DUF3224 domain-containing protein [Terriglobales bacterium]